MCSSDLGARPLAFCHLDDAVAAIRLAAVDLPAGAYAPANAATEVLTAHEVREAVDLAARRAGYSVPDEGPVPAVSSRFTVSSRLREVGWAPRRQMPEAIADVLSHFGETIAT